LKRWYDDTDLKNAIKVTGAGLTEEDYSISRGGIYGTYKIKFTRTKANYGTSIKAYLKNRNLEIEDVIKIRIDLNSKVSQANDFQDVTKTMPVWIDPHTLDRLTLKQDSFVNPSASWMKDGSVLNAYYEYNFLL
jgi:hypothetical protein